MNKVVERFKKILNIYYVMVVLNIIVGLLFFFKPSISNKVSLMIIGSLIAINGLHSLINYFYDGLGNKFFKMELLFGVFDLLIGILVILNPVTTINILAIGVGLWLIVSGLESGYYAAIFWKNNEDISPLVTFVSVVSVIMGILVVINPFKSFMLVTKLIGLFMVAYSGITIIRVNLFKKRAKNILKMFD